LVFHPVAVVGKLVHKQKIIVHVERNHAQKNTKNRTHKAERKTYKTNTKRIIKAHITIKKNIIKSTR
jgi:hypothetical protein